MIFVTTGTNEQPFDRLLRAVRALPDRESLHVQYGSSQISDGPGRWEAFMDFAECDAAVRRARVVVTHAGVGSVMLSLRHGKRPVVMPRRHARDEAVDDHQVVLARRLAQAGWVAIADEGNLAEAIELAAAMGPIELDLSAGHQAELVAELHDYFDGLVLPRVAATPALVAGPGRTVPRGTP